MKDLNLINDPWLPVDNKPYSLFYIFNNSQHLSTLSGETPVINFSLMRMITTIVSRAYSINTIDDWKKLWDQKRFDNIILAYLEKWASRFNVFDHRSEDPRPFYQNFNVPDRSATGINNLVLHFAHGNNATRISQNFDDVGELSLSDAIINLITIQNFGTGGLSGYKERRSFVKSPLCFKTVLMAWGNNLFETIMLNLLPSTYFPLENQEIDEPVWEMPSLYSIKRSKPLGIYDYLTWQPREVLLFPSENKDDMIEELRWVPSESVLADGTISDPWVIPGLRCITADHFLFKSLEYLSNEENGPTICHFWENLYKQQIYTDGFLRISLMGLQGFQSMIEGQVDTVTIYPLSEKIIYKVNCGLKLLQTFIEAVLQKGFGLALYRVNNDMPSAKALSKDWNLNGQFSAMVRIYWSMYIEKEDLDEEYLKKNLERLSLNLINQYTFNPLNPESWAQYIDNNLSPQEEPEIFNPIQ